MRIIATLSLCWALAACGGSSKGAAEPAAQPEPASATLHGRPAAQPAPADPAPAPTPADTAADPSPEEYEAMIEREFAGYVDAVCACDTMKCVTYVGAAFAEKHKDDRGRKLGKPSPAMIALTKRMVDCTTRITEAEMKQMEDQQGSGGDDDDDDYGDIEDPCGG